MSFVKIANENVKGLFLGPLIFCCTKDTPTSNVGLSQRKLVLIHAMVGLDEINLNIIITLEYSVIL